MIIVITGTLGAGKGTIAEYLAHSRGFKHFSVRSFLIEEIAHRGLPQNRDSMTMVANDLRAKHGSSYIVRELYRDARKNGENAIIESVRTLGEASFLKQHGVLLWAVDADRRERYKRIVARASETDKISFEKFVADEERELKNNEPTKQNISAVMEQADILFLNDGSFEDLYTQIEKHL